jgi:hypothetical protein
VTTEETNKQRLGINNITTNKLMIINPKVLPQRLLQAGDIVVDSAKMADMPEEIPVVNPVTDHALTGVAVDLLGTGASNHRIDDLLGSLVINRDVLETTPDVVVGKENDLGLPRLVDLGDRFEQGLGLQSYLLIAYAHPSRSQFVTKTLARLAMTIVVPPVR